LNYTKRTRGKKKGGQSIASKIIRGGEIVKRIRL